MWVGATVAWLNRSDETLTLKQQEIIVYEYIRSLICALASHPQHQHSLRKLHIGGRISPAT